MSDHLPEYRSPSEVNPKALRAHTRAKLEVFYHDLAQHVRSQKDQIDTMALGDALRCSLREEMDLLDEGLDLANGSQAKLEILAPKLALFARKNNARIDRRF
jgi:hypothetical protein